MIGNLLVLYLHESMFSDWLVTFTWAMAAGCFSFFLSYLSACGFEGFMDWLWEKKALLYKEVVPPPKACDVIPIKPQRLFDDVIKQYPEKDW